MTRIKVEWVEWASDESVYHQHASTDWWWHFYLQRDVDKILTEYRARLDTNIIEDATYLVFENDEDATAFLLRWS